MTTSFYLRLAWPTSRRAGAHHRHPGRGTTSASTPCCSANRPRARTQTDLIILTHDTVEGRMNKALAQMQALPTVLAPIVRIRKEELS